MIVHEALNDSRKVLIVGYIGFCEILSNWCGIRCSICIADLVNDVIALKDLVMMISVFHCLFSIGSMGAD